MRRAGHLPNQDGGTRLHARTRGPILSMRLSPLSADEVRTRRSSVALTEYSLVVLVQDDCTVGKKILLVYVDPKILTVSLLSMWHIFSGNRSAQRSLSGLKW